MKFEDLTPEQREKAKSCKNPEELLAMAREEGYELSNEQLQAVSGGDWSCWDVCSGYDPNKDYYNCPTDSLCNSFDGKYWH